jgi:hypothetical protein
MPIPNPVLQSKGDMRGVASDNHALSEEEAQIVKGLVDDKRLYMTGIVIYEDVFKATHFTKFCFSLTPTEKMTAAGMRKVYEWELAHVHNEAT